jgi:hypothetical protein
MPCYGSNSERPTFATLLRCFRQDAGRALFAALPGQRLEQIAQEEGVAFGQGPYCVYTPAITLWAFLTQCLSSCKSCVGAVARVMVLRVALEGPPCSAATGAYCKARAKLAEAFLRRLALEVGNQVEDQAPDRWRWHNRRALLIDGAVSSMPDTQEKQAQYPQSGGQKQGLGFPQIRLVVLLTFATAGLVGGAMGPCKGKESGETALFRSLLDQLRAGDVAVADRYHCSYWPIALVQQRGADAAFRLHQRRRYDFRTGRRLGRGDHLLRWAKPKRPAWLDEATYANLPDTLEIREIKITLSHPGLRTRQVVVATTLSDPKVFSKEDIADLYHKRWHVELDIRAIKQTLKMDILSCKTPEMVRKEIWAHLLAYNLVRQALTQAALAEGLTPRGLSFAGGVQTLNAFRWLLLLGQPQRRAVVWSALLRAVATHRVGNRPGRCEPRRVKRRPKPYPKLTKPRAQARAELLQH